MKKLFTILVAFHLMILPMPKAHAIGGMGQITGVAVASVGVSLAKACGIKSASLMLYIAGAAAYLMGEMAAAKAQKQQLKNKEDETKKLQEDGKMGGETQLATLEAQLKAKEEELKLANKRKMWAMAAMAAFIAAAAVAVMEIPPYFPPLVCNSGTAMAISMPIGAGVVAAYSFMGGGGIMGALTGAVGGAVATSSMVANAMNTNTTRAIAMGAMAALVALSAMEAGKAAKKLQGEIDDLKKVIAQFKLETDGTGPNSEDVTGGAAAGSTSGLLAGTTSGAAGGVSSGGGSGVTPLPGGEIVGGTTTCLNSSQQLSSNCSNPMTFSSPNLAMFGNQPDLQQASNMAAEFGNTAARGDIGKADVAAASLSGLATKMSDLLKKNRAAMNKKLVAQGKKPIDFDKETQDMLKSMQSSYQKETAGKSAQLAAFGLDKISLDPNAVDKSGQNIAGASTSAAVAVPTSDGKAADAVAPGESTTAIATEAGKAAQESAASALGKNLGDYESNDGDISAKKEESLWKQVSNRYLLNYGRFFERNKLPSQ